MPFLLCLLTGMNTLKKEELVESNNSRGKGQPLKERNQLQVESNFWQRPKRNVGNNVLGKHEEDRLENMFDKPTTFGNNL